MHAFMTGIWAWLAANPLVLFGALAVAALLLWKQPRQTMKLLLAVLVIVALGYLVSGIVHFTMGSAMIKGQMIEKSQ
jgi:CHASE2 domain-containing sensor protein